MDNLIETLAKVLIFVSSEIAIFVINNTWQIKTQFDL